MAPVFSLFLIIFIEGYIMLSTELLAIRLLIPFTGSGTDTVSIIIAAILMPLAFGYYAGGRFRMKRREGRRTLTVRNRLVLNLVIAAAFLTPGLSYAFLEWAFDLSVSGLGWTNRIWLTTVYSALFLVIPVFLLGQTVPLISNYFSRERLSVIAGRILFFSTMGSFMGAVFCTLVLMSLIGVHNAVIVTIGCMTILTFILAKRKISPATLAMTLCLLLSAALNSSWMMAKFNVVKNNKYNLIQIQETADGTRIMGLNRTMASAVNEYSTAPIMLYAAHIDSNFVKPLYDDTKPPHDILVLGAGGFTIGQFDNYNHFTYVDIDKDLKDVAEQDLLKEKLGSNKKFIPIEARAYLNQAREKYDLIILDLYRDPISAPEYLITREFYVQVKKRLKHGGVIAGNYFASPTFSDLFSVKIDNTIRSVFPHVNRQVITSYDAWNRDNDWTNIVYSYVDTGIDSSGIYTDDKNTSMFERPANLRHQAQPANP